MSKLRVHLYGDPVLRQKAEPIEQITDEIRQLAEDMLVTMYEEEGIGLAAPQVGRSIRLLVVDPQAVDETAPGAMAFINPETTESSGEWTYDEGCLSIPGIVAEIKRPEKVRVHYFDTNGEERHETFDGMMARVLQHEMDHLEGKLFVDYLSPMRRALIMKKLREISKEGQGEVEEVG
ncbi:MAG: peptide deformylase [Candidatus Eisenbacteria bacterium]|uniref:Peptide deformylase n=1 Tax=Eiseniibacteriota bacterium TaxID=2212470 RepID=A0A948W7D6_UNCEI|nr:peptide deformylase [Candidatus Eisenbacteria bacterium]MBU1950903.1 peptide deformylase [Candidatus Eisenbacteria bacterium]MBU2692125.1 peptide deformylase [Candidatus Eisenbacteria bacterium]